MAIKHKPAQTDTYIVGTGGWTAHRFVKLSADNTAVMCTANAAILGVSDVAEATAARMGEVHISGIVSVYAGDTVAAGQKVKSDANGAAVPVGSTGLQNEGGLCIIGGAVGELISIILQQGGSIKAPYIEQEIELADFTDNADATGYLDLTDQLPAGAFVLGWDIVVSEGFTSAADTTTSKMAAGTSTDLDRFTGAVDPSVIAAATVGSAVNDGDGNAYVAADTTVRVTLTEDSDFGDYETGAGTIRVYYIPTA